MDCPFDLAGKWTYDFGWAYMMIEVLKESKVLIYMEYAYGDNGGSDGDEQQ